MFEPKDILVYESGNGGDITILGGDIGTTQQLLQQVYLALFGGNLEAETTGQELPGEIREDYWANSLFFLQKKEKQFNSQTERVLNETPLTSSGRIKIKQAAEADLTYLSAIASMGVDVLINSTNKVTIEVKISQPNNQNNQLNFIWDKAKQQVITEYII